MAAQLWAGIDIWESEIAVCAPPPFEAAPAWLGQLSFGALGSRVGSRYPRTWLGQLSFGALYRVAVPAWLAAPAWLGQLSFGALE